MHLLIAQWNIGAAEVSLRCLLPSDAYVRRPGDKRVVELTDLIVPPAQRGQGHAKVLMDAALRHARRYGWAVFLRAVPFTKHPADLDRLIAFYRRYGFRQVQRGDKREFILRW